MILGNSFYEYFSDGELNAAQQWIINPFLFDLTTMSDDDNLKEDLIEIKSFQKFQLFFKKSKLDNFCCVVMEAFPNLAKENMRMTILFLTTILVKVSFRQ